MAYDKINWTNQATPLNANNLNHMEDGIAETDVQASTLAVFESLGWESVDSNVISSLLNFIGGKLSEELWQTVYPVGIYVDISKPQSEFDPNEAWGGTWELDSEGRVLIGAGTNDGVTYTVGETGGSKDAIIPNHDHGVSALTTAAGGSHTHRLKGYGDTLGKGSEGWRFGSSGSQWATGIPENSGSHTHTIPAFNTKNANGGEALENKNMMPYTVVCRWHRIA